jgi:hypothetical protein
VRAQRLVQLGILDVREFERQVSFARGARITRLHRLEPARLGPLPKELQRPADSLRAALNRVLQKADSPVTPRIQIRLVEEPHTHQHIDGTDMLLRLQRTLGGASDTLFESEF